MRLALVGFQVMHVADEEQGIGRGSCQYEQGERKHLGTGRILPCQPGRADTRQQAQRDMLAHQHLALEGERQVADQQAADGPAEGEEEGEGAPRPNTGGAERAQGASASSPAPPGLGAGGAILTHQTASTASRKDEPVARK